MDEEMRQVPHDMFEGCTVVTVAHWLESIVDADVVLVTDGGSIAEVGDPQELKEKVGSVFRGRAVGGEAWVVWRSRHTCITISRRYSSGYAMCYPALYILGLHFK